MKSYSKILPCKVLNSYNRQLLACFIYFILACFIATQVFFHMENTEILSPVFILLGSMYFMAKQGTLRGWWGQNSNIKTIEKK